MSTKIVCDQCATAYRVRDEFADRRCRCPRGHVLIVPPHDSDTRMSDGFDGEADRRPAAAGGNPWMPSQIVAVAFVFGSIAAGVITGLNMARMGRRSFLIPCVVAGCLLFLTMVGIMVLLPDPMDLSDTVPRLVGMVFRLGVGLAFLLVQKSTFDEWKEKRWVAADGARYRPGNVGQLVLVCLGCAAVEVGLIVLVVSVA